MVALLVVALVVAVIVIVWLLAKQSRQSPYRYTEADLANARQDSLTRSHSVVTGKVQEHLAPLFPEFLSQFNPRDARFLGSPLDFIIFDGLDSGEGVNRVVFVEVKSGKASLQKRERQCKDAICKGKVEYQLLRLPGPDELLPAGEETRALAAAEEAPALQF